MLHRKQINHVYHTGRSIVNTEHISLPNINLTRKQKQS